MVLARRGSTSVEKMEAEGRDRGGPGAVNSVRVVAGRPPGALRDRGPSTLAHHAEPHGRSLRDHLRRVLAMAKPHRPATALATSFRGHDRES